MLSHYIDLAFVYIESGSTVLKDYVYIFTFLGAFLESIPVIGTFIPGSIILLLMGYFSSLHYINLAWVILGATIGSMLGEIVGYMIGKYGGAWMIRHKKILKIGHIEQGRAFFSKHGGKSIFVARFVAPVRPIVALVAGSIHLRMQTFIFWNILGAFAWSTVFLTLGYFFGSYADKIEKIISRTGLVLSVIMIGFGFWYYYAIYRKKKDENN